jgi:nucleotide-binding universal stress UspA family protein
MSPAVNEAGTAMRHIMVATDGSRGAERAVDFAVELTKAIGGKLSIVTIAGNLSGEGIRQLARSEGNIGDCLEALATQVLMEARQRAQHFGLPVIQVETAWGDPAEAIIGIAGRQAADAIVVGRRGRGRLAGLLLGSVSQKLVSLAPCTVIVVP